MPICPTPTDEDEFVQVQRLAAVNITHASVVLTWMLPPSTSLHLTPAGYCIHWIVDSAPYFDVDVPAMGNLNMTAEELEFSEDAGRIRVVVDLPQSFVQYNISVSTRYSGHAAFAQLVTIQVTTLSGDPTAGVVNLTVVNSSTFATEVSWYQPDGPDLNGVPAEYLVTYTHIPTPSVEAGAATSGSVIVPATASQVYTASLPLSIPRANYSVSVAIRNQDRPSYVQPRAITLQVPRGTAPISAFIRNLTTETMSNSTIAVSWYCSGCIDATVIQFRVDWSIYTMPYGYTAASSSGTVHVDSSSYTDTPMTVVIGNLLSYVTYAVIIRDSADESILLPERVFVRTLAGDPTSSVRGATGAVLDNTRANISFLQPPARDLHGIPAQYKLVCSLVVYTEVSSTVQNFTWIISASLFVVIDDVHSIVIVDLTPQSVCACTIALRNVERPVDMFVQPSPEFSFAMPGAMLTASTGLAVTTSISPTLFSSTTPSTSDASTRDSIALPMIISGCLLGCALVAVCGAIWYRCRNGSCCDRKHARVILGVPARREVLAIHTNPIFLSTPPMRSLVPETGDDGGQMQHQQRVGMSPPAHARYLAPMPVYEKPNDDREYAVAEGETGRTVGQHFRPEYACATHVDEPPMDGHECSKHPTPSARTDRRACATVTDDAVELRPDGSTGGHRPAYVTLNKSCALQQRESSADTHHFQKSSGLASQQLALANASHGDTRVQKQRGGNPEKRPNVYSSIPEMSSDHLTSVGGNQSRSVSLAKFVLSKSGSIVHSLTYMGKKFPKRCTCIISDTWVRHNSRL